MINGLKIKTTVKKVWKSKDSGRYLTSEGKNVRVATDAEVKAYTEKLAKVGKVIPEI